MKKFLLFLTLVGTYLLSTPINASDNPDASKEYSDHELFSAALKGNDGSGGILIRNLNVAQSGKLNIYPNYDKKKKPQIDYVWSSTLRTVPILAKLQKNEGELNTIAKSFGEIADNKELKLADKNQKMEEKTKEAEPKLKAMGFSIKSVTMEPTRTFNPAESDSKKFREKPNEYVKGPIFNLETEDDFGNRMAVAFKQMSHGTPPVITTQEIELGTKATNALFMDKLFPEYKKEGYGVIIPEKIPQGDIASSCVVTFYDEGLFENVSAQHAKEISAIRTIFEHLFNQMSSVKLLVSALKSKHSDEIFYVVNLHEDFGPANKSAEVYGELRKVFDSIPGLILGADLNLLLNNGHWIKDAFSTFKGPFVTQRTPDTVEGGGNPSWDVIIASPRASAPPPLEALVENARAFNARIFPKKT